jgi:hypothetical protein
MAFRPRDYELMRTSVTNWSVKVFKWERNLDDSPPEPFAPDAEAWLRATAYRVLLDLLEQSTMTYLLRVRRPSLRSSHRRWVFQR